MSDNEDLNINIGADPSGVEAGSRAAKAAINQVNQEAKSLEKAFRSLRSAMDPMYAVQAKYNEALANSAKLLAAGRISEEEYAASVNAATAALTRQSAEQLKGTAVAKQASEATKAASRSKADAEIAAAASIAAASKTSSATRAAEEARLTAQTALEVKARAALAVVEAQQRLDIARKSAEQINGLQRNSKGQFVSTAAIQAERAAAVAAAEEQLRLAQIDATAANQKARNAQRVANTREEAARRAAAAEQVAASAAATAAATASSAAEASLAAQATLTAAQEQAAAAAIAAAQAQSVEEAEAAAAYKAKAQAALEAALAEEAEAKAAAEAAKAAAAQKRALVEEAAAQRKAAQEEAARVANAERLKASLDPAYAAQVRYNQAVNMANTLAGTGHIDEATRVKAVASAQRTLEDALKHGTKATINNKAAYEALVTVHEALSHRWTRLAGSSMILGQALIGQATSAEILTAVFSPLGIAIMATVGTIGALVFAAYKGSEAMNRLQQSLAVTGQYAGMSAQEIDKAAKQIAASTHTSIGTAEESLGTLAASGRVAGQTMITMGEIVSRVSEMTHQKAAVVAGELVKMADDPANAMKRLNDQYHFLTPTQQQHIRDLIEQGDKTQAVTELSELWVQKLRQEQTELTGLAGVLHDVGIGLGDFWQHLMDIGKAPDPADRLRTIVAQLERIKKLQAEGKNIDVYNAVHAVGGESVTGLQQEAAGIQKKIDADKTAAHKAQLDQQATDDRNALDALETTTRSNHEKMLREMHAWRTEADRLMKNPEASAEDKRDAAFRLAHPQALDEAIKKKFDRADFPTSKGPGQVSVWAEQLHAMEIQSTDFFKDETDDELKFWTAKLALTKKGSKDWLEVQTKVYDLQKKKAKDNYEEDKLALKDKISAAEGNLAEEEKAWQTYLEKVRSVMGATSKAYKEAVKEYIDARVKIAEAQKKADEEMQKGIFHGQEANIGMKQDLFTFKSDMGMSSAREQLAEQKQIMNEEYAAKVANENRIFEIEQQTAAKINALPGADAATKAAANAKLLEARATLNSNLLSLDQQHARDVAQINIQTAELTLRKWKETADLINQGFMNAFQGMWTHTQSFKQSMLQMADSIVYKFVQAGLDMLQHWVMTQIALRVAHTTTQAAMTASTAAGATARAGIENANFFSVMIGKLAAMLGIHIGTEAAKTTATGAGAIARIAENKVETAAYVGSAAAVAGANGVASWALAPWPLDMGAPAFGASMAAAALGYGALAVAEKGYGEVGNDNEPALLHKKEMVLPAKFAEPLRQQLTKRNSNGIFSAAGASANSNTTNNNGAPVFNYQPTHHYKNMDAEEMLARDGAVFRKWFHNQVRNGNIKVG